MRAKNNPNKGNKLLFDQKALGEDVVFMTPPHAPSVVTTLSPNGAINVAAFEQTVLCSDIPPMIILAITKENDSYKNIIATKECVIGFTYPEYMQEVYDAGVHLPREQSELPLLERFTTAPSRFVKPPRIEQCWLSLEAKFLWGKETGDHMTCCLEIVGAAFDKELWHDGSANRRSELPALYYITHGNFFTKGNMFALDHSEKVKAVDKNTR